MRIGSFAAITLAMSLAVGCTISTTTLAPGSTPGSASSTSGAGVINPVIVSFTANPSVLKAGQTVAVQAKAVSSSGRTLAYTWSATGGTLSTTTGTAVNWTAPSQAGTYSILLTVTDGAGGSAAGSLNIIVSSDGGVTVGKPTYQSPSPSPTDTSTGATVRWSQVYGVTGFNDAFFLNSNLGWTAGPGGQVNATTNGGSSWIGKTLTSQNLRTVFFASPNNGWAAGDNGALFITTDGGNTWKLTDWSGAGSETINAIVFRDLANGYMFTDSATYESSDGGQTWTQAFPQGGANATLMPTGAIYLTGPGTDYRSRSRYEISLQGALSSMSIGGGTSFSASFPDVTKPAMGWAISHDDTQSTTGEFYKSTDSGVTWEPVSKLNNGTQFLTSFDGRAVGFTSPTTGLFISSDMTFARKLVTYETYDGGTTWSVLDDSWDGSNYEDIKRFNAFDATHATAVLRDYQGGLILFSLSPLD